MFFITILLWNKNRAAIVTVLPGLGIFGTFLGIVYSLMSLDFMDIRNSLPRLTEGMSIGFISSLLGLGIANVVRIYLEMTNKMTKEEASLSSVVEILNKNNDCLSNLTNTLLDEESNPVVKQVKNLRLEMNEKSGQLINEFKNIKLNLVIIGDGQEMENLQDLAKSLNIFNKCWFYGDCYNESEIANLIYNSDLCISPGNVGLTAIHSLVYGTPVITHSDFNNQGPEFEAIVPGKTGDFFEKNSLESLISVVNNWFNINRDKVPQNCFKIIDKYYNPTYQYNVIKKVIEI